MSSEPVSTERVTDTLALGSDHAGFELKERLKDILSELGVAWKDMGTNSTESCDSSLRLLRGAVISGE